MHVRFLVSIGLLLTLMASPALAQRRVRARAAGPVPDTGMGAIGVSGGASIPDDPSLSKAFEVAGNLEGYLTPRVSVRGQVGLTTWDIVGRGFSGTVRPLYVDGNVVYNWEGGRVHPYVTAGIGWYHYSFDIPPRTGSDNKLGVDVGGGVEYFLHRHFTITGEALYHAVDSPVAAPITTFQSRFWSLRAGIKQYF